MNKIKRQKKYFVLMLLVMSVAGPIQGQRTVISKAAADSVMAELGHATGQDHSAAYNMLARYYFSFNIDSAKFMALQAIEEAREYNNKKELGYAYKNIGNYQMHQSNPDSAFYYYGMGEVVFSDINHSEGLAAIYNNIGVIHKNLGQYDLALKYFKRIREQTAGIEMDAAIKASLYSNLAGIYYLQNNPDIGVKYLDSARILTESIPQDYIKGVIYNNMGRFFTSIGRYDKALTMLQKAEAIFDPQLHRKMTYITYNNLGDIYQGIYNYDRAETYYRKSLEISKSGNDAIGTARTSLRLADLLIVRKDHAKARQHLTKALVVFDSIGDNYAKAEAMLALADSYVKEGKPAEALEYLEKHREYIQSTGSASILKEYYNILHKAYYADNNFKQGYEALQVFHRYQDTLEDSKQKANNHVLQQELKLSRQSVQQEINKLKAQSEASNREVFLIFYAVIGVLILAAFFILYRYIREKRTAAEQAEQHKQTQQALKKLQEEKRAVADQVEEAVKERTAKLQKEVDTFRKKDNQLKKTLKEVEDANYLKNAFLSNMSHEIRTPLNGIIGFASLLETELSLLENQELHSYASGIQQSGERLLHLLNNIIDISRIEANDLQVSLQESNISQLIEKSAEIYKYQASEKNLSFNIKLEDSPMVYVDPDSVTKVLSDIMDNAVKYTEKGFINVTNGYDAKKKEVFVKIRDTGIGIDDNYLPKVFEAFRQESLGYSRAFQGAGLGLPLAKRLLDLMNGRIDIESTKDEGTTVVVFLPTKETFRHVEDSLHPERQKAGEEQQSLANAVKKARVFLVEDDRMNRLVINKMLTGWNLDSAEDGDITIEKIEKAFKEGVVYDIMLFDINLPNPWDGVKLMHYIKKKYPEYDEVPFIAQTAYAMRGDRERLLEEGFDDYMSKPISQQRLLTTMYKFLKKEGGTS